MENIEAKIAAYEEQLRQVTSFLETDAHNEQFLSLRRDLQKLIELTGKLTDITKPPIQQAEGVMVSAGAVKVEAEVDSDEELESAFKTTQRSSSSSDAVISSSKMLRIVSTGALQVGDNVAVTSAETTRPFAAVIMSLIPDKQSCTVKYFEFFDNPEVTLPLTAVVHLSSVLGRGTDTIPRPDQITPGLRCHCRYSADQVVYEAVIDKAITGPHCGIPAHTGYRGNSYAVTYSGYGNSEIVPIEYIQLITSTAAAVAGADHHDVAVGEADDEDVDDPYVHVSASAHVDKHGLDHLIVIPESLKIKPEDSEAEKIRKKKKIKAIKSRNRLICKDNEQTEVKNTWQKFIKKVRIVVIIDH